MIGIVLNAVTADLSHAPKKQAVRKFRLRVATATTAATLVGLFAASGAAALATPAAAASSGVVVNEVYGGGGNSGATLTNDFIELANRSNAAVTVDGWSVQYHSGSATGSWQTTALSGSISA